MIPQPGDWQKLELFIKAFAQITQNFIHDLDDKKVAELGAKIAPHSFTQSGIGFQNALEHLCDHVVPQLSASRGPRYWGFVTGGATPVATFADWLVASFDQNVSKDGDSVASNIERQTLAWLCELFELPVSFDGIITTGATASNFLGALCARQFSGHQQNIDTAKDGLAGLDVEIFAANAHASMIKSLGMAGFGQRNVTLVKTLPNSEAMDVADLSHKLSRSIANGKIVIASAGTVTATDFDDLTAISKLTQQYHAWLHVDGAFGIFARLIDGDSRTAGIEFADSITLDSHKWLNVPYESGVFLTRHINLLVESCDVPAPYLISEGDRPDFMSLGVENSRRFRALPVWMTLLTYGKQGIADWVQRNILCAQLLAKQIAESPNYELVHDCQLNVVLFRPDCKGLDNAQADQKTSDYLLKINQEGRVFVSPGVWQGRKIIRAALSNWQTREIDVEIAMQSFNEVAKSLG